MKNNENEIPKLNKDFSISQQKEVAQKTQEEHARQTSIQQITNEKERQRIERMTQTRDREVKRDVRLKQEKQKQTVQDEIQKRLDAQRGPKLDHRIYKTFLGQSPQMVADKTMAEFKVAHQNELAGFQSGIEATWNKQIDKKIDKAIEQQQEQERQQKAERTFEKSATQSPDSSKEAFKNAHDRTGGEKDWRSLREDRQQGKLFDR
ncbi:MAG: hypothetical protein GY748_25970 [Planctomycetaceae bacterium]|nr:hypothetical protein [Planctomycetaceae bacterium]